MGANHKTLLWEGYGNCLEPHIHSNIMSVIPVIVALMVMIVLVMGY